MDKPHLRDTERVMGERTAQWVVQSFTRSISLVHVALGVAILTGGARRFGGLSYQYALDTPGAPWSWGLIALAAGIGCILATYMDSPRGIAASMFVMGFWALFFAITFARAWAHFEEANSTAMVAYAGYALLCCILAGAHLATHPISLPRPWRRRP